LISFNITQKHSQVPEHSLATPLLYLSSGITSLLDNAMSSLHVNLPGNARPVSAQNNNTQHTHTGKKGNLEVGSVDNSIEKRIELIELFLQTKGEEKVKENKDDEGNIRNINNNENIANKNDDKKESNDQNKESHESKPSEEFLETKYKLESIDKILGFDAEKDKKDFFSGQLKNQIQNSNIGENGYRGNITELRNSVGQNDTSINPNFKANSSFPIGKFSPISLFSGSDNERISRQNEPKIVFAGDVSPSITRSDREYGRSINSNYSGNYQNNNNSNSNEKYNDNNSNTLNRSRRNVLTVNFDGKPGSVGQINRPNASPSAPPIYPRNLVQNPVLGPSPLRGSRSSEMTRKSDDNDNYSRGMDLEQRSYAAFDAKLKNQKDIYNDIKTNIGSDSRIRGNSLFSPPSFPPEGAAIRALRSTQKTKIMKENSLDPGSLRKESNRSVSPDQYSYDKENIFQNKNVVLPDFSSPVHDRQEYLNKMKKMRELMTSQ
jgi:hypothetical protein